MPYVPPHLRTSSGGSAPPPANGAPTTSTSRDNYGDRERGRDYGSSFGGSRRDAWPPDKGQSQGRTESISSGPAPAKRGLSNPEPVFPAWQPSKRAQAMTAAQIADTRERLSITLESAEGSGEVPAPIESFDDMSLHENIIRDIRSKEYDKPTPIQAQGIPVGMSGRDILGCAETGSGKTASFAIPMIQHCLSQPSLRRGDGPIALVLAPTRELAQQIDRETAAGGFVLAPHGSASVYQRAGELAQQVKDFSRTSRTVNSAIVVGGTNMSEQRGDLRAGVEIVVATPGRFIDHLQQNNTSLNRVSFVVLDEADRMLDMGFEPQIREVMQNLKQRHQTLLFSATMPVEIEDMAGTYLNNPIRVKVGQVSTPTANVAQALAKTTEAQKLEDCAGMLVEEQTQASGSGQRMPLTIIFVERKARCDDVAELLRSEGLQALALHGGLSQGDREHALREFTAGNAQVLVATDVASRGLDVKGIGHVVNLDLPRTFEDYVHRIGRTGRAGTSGRATSFWTDRDSFLVSQIKKAISELESGNTFAFATGKAARQKEKEAAQEFRQALATGPSAVVQSGAAAIKVDDKYKFMTAAASKQGAADDAWDD